MPRTNKINLQAFYNNIIRNNPLLFDHQFVVTFSGSDLPSFFETNPEKSGQKTPITYYIKSADVPEISIGEATINFLAQDFVVPKGITYGGTWDVKLMTTNTLNHWVALRNWQRIYADLERNGGGNRAVPDIKAHVKVLDSSMQNILHDFVLEGVFPSKVPDIDMKYENNSTIPETSIQFTYQYMYYDNDGENGKNDPLNATQDNNV